MWAYLSTVSIDGSTYDGGCMFGCYRRSRVSEKCTVLGGRYCLIRFMLDDVLALSQIKELRYVTEFSTHNAASGCQVNK